MSSRPGYLGGQKLRGSITDPSSSSSSSSSFTTAKQEGKVSGKGKGKAKEKRGKVPEQLSAEALFTTSITTNNSEPQSGGTVQLKGRKRAVTDSQPSSPVIATPGSAASTARPPLFSARSLRSFVEQWSSSGQTPSASTSTPTIGAPSSGSNLRRPSGPSRTPSFASMAVSAVSATLLEPLMPKPKAAVVLADLEPDEVDDSEREQEKEPEKRVRGGKRFRHAWSMAQAAADGQNMPPTVPQATSPWRSWSTVLSLSPPPLYDAQQQKAFPFFSSLASHSRQSTSSTVDSDASMLFEPVPREMSLSPPTRPTSSGTDEEKCALLDDEGSLRHARSPPHSAVAYSQDAQGGWSRVMVSTASWNVSWPPIRPHLPALLSIGVFFLVWTALVVASLSTLPLKIPAHGLTHLEATEIRDMALSLRDYAESSSRAGWHVWCSLMLFFTWKQVFNIPGSIIMLVTLGAVEGTYKATLNTTIFTGIGGVGCYLLARSLAPFIESLPGLHKPLSAMRGTLSKTGNNLWSYLLLLRLVPIVPWGLMNICCGVLRVPLWAYFGTLTLGSIPWNYITCQIGDILQEIVAALPEAAAAAESSGGAASATSGLSIIAKKVYSREMMIKLFLLSIVSLLPMVLSRWLKKSGAQFDVQAGEEEQGLAEPLTMGEAEEAFAPIHSRAPSFASAESSQQPYRPARMHEHLPSRIVQ